MVFRFRALSDENDNFVRDWELAYNSSLLDFHNHICTDLEYDPCTMASFHLSDSFWEKCREFTLLDMGMAGEDEVIAMENVRLDAVIEDNGDRLIYTFDVFGDRSLFIEMMGAYKAEEGASYPRTVLAEGAVPPQFDAAKLDADNSIFDEAMGEFSGFDGDEMMGDDF